MATRVECVDLQADDVEDVGLSLHIGQLGSALFSRYPDTGPGILDLHAMTQLHHKGPEFENVVVDVADCSHASGIDHRTLHQQLTMLFSLGHFSFGSGSSISSIEKDLRSALFIQEFQKVAAFVLTMIASVFIGGGLWLGVGSRFRLSPDDAQNDLFNCVAFILGAIPISFVIVFFGIGA